MEALKTAETESGFCAADGQSGIDQLCGRVLQIIDKEYMDETLTLQSVSDRLHVSASYLGPNIKKNAGDTFINLLIRKRMAVALNLLQAATAASRKSPAAADTPTRAIFIIALKVLRRFPCQNAAGARAEGSPRMKKRSLSMNQIMILSLTAIVVGILGCAIAFFLQTYQRSLIRNAQTDGRRTISQVTSTVDSYLSDMNNVMELLADELVTPSDDREHFFETFAKIRSDVVAVTIYDEAGYLMNCYSLGHEVRPVVRENLSFDRTMLDVYADGYVSAPPVMSLFEGVLSVGRNDHPPGGRGQVGKMGGGQHQLHEHFLYINGIGIGQQGCCSLEDTNGNIVYHPQQQLIYSDLKQKNTA